MSQLLQETASPRGDDGVWEWVYGETIKTPFYFDWKGITAAGDLIDLEISPDCPITFTLKRDKRDRVPVFQKDFTIIKDNVLLFEVSTEELLQIRPGITYTLGAILYNKNKDKIIRVLIRELPVKVLDSMAGAGEYYGSY